MTARIIQQPLAVYESPSPWTTRDGARHRGGSIRWFHNFTFKRINILTLCFSGYWHTLKSLTRVWMALIKVSAGHYHTCGVRTDKTVACWG
ncbi:MAG: hypothetical protein EA420_00390 [Candidatus Competibacteraceae bacterium]|nr:MAG: hypothetical protein EA420_00390 [Candidatus Competibacteraceae bacterium]